MSKITYANKVKSKESGKPVTETCRAIDLNEIKNSVNFLYDGSIKSIRTITNDDLIVSTDYTILADATSNTVTVSLPASPEEGRIYNVKCINDTFTCDISGNGNNIDGSASNIVLAVTDSLTFQYDSTYGWSII